MLNMKFDQNFVELLSHASTKKITVQLTFSNYLNALQLSLLILHCKKERLSNTTNKASFSCDNSSPRILTQLNDLHGPNRALIKQNERKTEPADICGLW